MSVVLSHSPIYTGQAEFLKIQLTKEYGSFNLVEKIKSSFLKRTSPNSIILIRRMSTDELFPYDCDTFIQWWSISGKDPTTLEDLSYLEKYITLKEIRL